MKSNKFINSLSLIPNFIGDKERQVEAVYNEMFKQCFPEIAISNPYKCDGYFECDIDGKKTRILCEYKYDFDLKSKVARSQILAQVCFYLKRFEKDGKPFPNVIFVGDVNECFVLHANDLLKWLDFEDVDWNGAASGAAANNPDFVLALANDETRNAYVFNVDADFDFEDVYNKICDYATNVTRLIRITEHNIDKVFDVFQKIIKEKNVSANDMVAYFFGCICDSENYYLHPTKKNTLVCNGKQIRIARDSFKAFMLHFSSSYSPKEKARLAAISDRLIEDTNRRRKGEFYTPTAWVDEAHRLVTKKLGDNWRDEYVVFDCCCGSKNLTRDYKFKELYCSTLEQAELDISKDYNPEAVSFQFDFLNDDLSKMPSRLIDTFKQNRKVLFLINPPYGMSGGVGNIEIGASNTKVKERMQKEGIEGSEFIKQFLWRITDIKRQYSLTNFSIAAFTNPTWIIKPQSKSFRKLFFDNFAFVDGFMFCAAEFADVSASWGITFNIWNSGNSTERNNFIHTLKKIDDNGIIDIGSKVLYNYDNANVITTSDFVTKNLPKKKHNDKIVVCKNIKNMEFEYTDVKIFDDYLCNIHVHANDISNNAWTCITNIPSNTGNDKNLTKANFFESCIVYAIRQYLTPSSWINDKDMYNMNVDIPAEFRNDCLTLTMFGNYCCGVKTDDGHRLTNHFFWADPKWIEQLADDCNNDEVYNDAHTMQQSFVYQKMQNIKFSPEAQAVIDAANSLLEKSMKYRQLFNDEFPDVQINNADAGMYQVGKLCKKYLPDDWKKFVETKKKLADKMRPMIYELGFLKQ